MKLGKLIKAFRNTDQILEGIKTSDTTLIPLPLIQFIFDGFLSQQVFPDNAITSQSLKCFLKLTPFFGGVF